MEPVGATADIIGIIRLSKDLLSGLKDYYDAFRDAREDIQKLYNAVKNLEATLIRVKEVFEGHGDEFHLVQGILTHRDGPLHQCQAELKSLGTMIGIPIAQGKSKDFVRTLKWPSKKKDIEKRIAALEEHKTSLILQVNLEHLYIFLID